MFLSWKSWQSKFFLNFKRRWTLNYIFIDGKKNIADLRGIIVTRLTVDQKIAQSVHLKKNQSRNFLYALCILYLF